MKKEKNFGDLVCGFYSFIGVVAVVVELCCFILMISGFETEMKVKLFGIELESLEYHQAKLYWERGNPMPKERLEIFYTVMDSLSEDVTVEYSLDENPTDFFYLTEETITRLYEIDPGNIAFARGGEVFLEPITGSEKIDDGLFAMILVHEYVHVIQYNHESYLNEYAKDVGWKEEIPQAEENFYKVLSQYSLENPHEDMSETYMFSYLCGNNLEALSEARIQHVEDFWGIPREQYCQNFH